MYARRLGVAGSSDRIRPLLVGLSSAEEANSLLSMAKSLRQSTDDTVRRSVYINRNLSATEARLAYEDRCRRRSRQPQQNTRPPPVLAVNQQTNNSQVGTVPADGSVPGYFPSQPSIPLHTTVSSRNATVLSSD